MRTLARDEDAREVVRRIQTLRPDSQRRWGRMSAHQMVCHLSDSCRMAAGELPVHDVAVPLPRAAVRCLALYLPVRWRAGHTTVPEIDQQMAGTRPGDFAADLAALTREIQALADRRGAMWPRHPVFGRMSEAEWLRWGYLHTDHHLRQFGA
jgi:hypothetical protein